MTANRIDAAELNNRINLLLLAEQDTALRKKTANEYSGPCPFCGGDDRFSVQSSRWLCRHCTEGKWRDGIDYAMRRGNLSFVEVARHYLGNDLPRMDEAVMAEREARRKAEQAASDERIRRITASLTTAEIWRAFHLRLTDDSRGWWAAQGIPAEWQDALELGYTADKQYQSDGEEHHSPAYTIPYFHGGQGGRVLRTLQYRLVNPSRPNDRYRFEHGLPAAFYEVEPLAPLAETAIICEGAKKAMVCRIYSARQSSVFGIPSKTTTAGIAEHVKACGRVYVILDPDGEREAHKLAASIGKAARVVRLHVKLDDGILRYGLDRSALQAAVRWAERVQ